MLVREIRYAVRSLLRSQGFALVGILCPRDGKGIRYQTLYSNSFHAFSIYPLPGIVGR